MMTLLKCRKYSLIIPASQQCTLHSLNASHNDLLFHCSRTDRNISKNVIRSTIINKHLIRNYYVIWMNAFALVLHVLCPELLCPLTHPQAKRLALNFV